MSAAQRYCKKPVEIDAMQWDGTAAGATPIINWILDNGGTASYYAPGEWDNGETLGTYLAINTLEGRMLTGIGDYVIRGVKGEFYPCKPDIFTATYEGPIIDPGARYREHLDDLNAREHAEHNQRQYAAYLARWHEVNDPT